MTSNNTSTRWRTCRPSQFAETQQFDLTPPAAELAETIDATPLDLPAPQAAPEAPSKPVAARKAAPLFSLDYFPPLAPWLLSLPADLRQLARHAAATITAGPLAELPGRVLGRFHLVDQYEKDGSHVVTLAYVHPLAAVEITARRLADRRAGWQVEWSIDW
jgi:hypothetical protein